MKRTFALLILLLEYTVSSLSPAPSPKRTPNYYTLLTLTLTQLKGEQHGSTELTHYPHGGRHGGGHGGRHGGVHGSRQGGRLGCRHGGRQKKQVAGLELDMVADMVVDKVADMVVSKVADMVADNKINFPK